MWRYGKLFRQFIVRSLAHEKLRTSLIILGISLGVGVMIAVRLANRSALASFRAATESIAGETTLEITGVTGRFDELLLQDLHWLDTYGDPSPIIDGYAMTEPASQASTTGEFLQVLGVDILRDRALRRYHLLRLSEAEREATSREFLLLLIDPHAIVLTEKFARRFNLHIGSTLPLLVGDRQLVFTVRGLLRDEGPAKALDGNFALVDIAAAQTAFQRLGFLDRLDLKLRGGVDPKAAEAAIAQRLPTGLTVRQPTQRYGQMEKMIAAFHFNLNALASIALLVGLFLIYNTVSISVITRREEIGMLRAVGTDRLLILTLFLGEAVLLASCGAVLGLGIGQLLANAAIRATANTVETFYFAAAVTQAAAPRPLGIAEVIFAFVIALPLAVLAATVPAREATRIEPLAALRGTAQVSRNARPSLRYVSLALLLLLLGYGVSFLEPVGGLPVWGYVAALALVFAGAMLVPGTLWLLCRGSTGFSRISALFSVERRLASANLSGALSRVAISVAALAVSLAMMVAISIMISSFRTTVEYWINETLRADIYVRPLTRTSSTNDGEIASEVVELMTRDPQVLAVDAFAAQTVQYQDTLITLAAGNFDVALTYGNLVFKAPADARVQARRAIGQDVVTVSESFALRFKKNSGDRIQLPTPRGPQSFTIAAVFYDYSNNRGVVVMDHSTHARYFPPTPPSSLSLYVQPGADANTVRDRLSQSLSGRFRLVLSTNGGLRGEAMRIFDSTFVITQALELIAIVVAALGVISTLITLILERQRDFALLSILGATRNQIRRMVVIEALLIGSTSQVIGLGVGVLLSVVLIYVINVQSFGWTIQFYVPVMFLLQSTALILIATAVAGLYPASRATGIDAVRFVREE
jgi:putative ABC transport system permease protein